MATRLDSAPTYPSLTSKTMTLGVPQDLLIAFTGAAVLFLGVVGFQILTVIGTITVFLLVLPFLRRVFEKEPFALELLQSYFMWPQFMPHHAKIDPTPKSDSVSRSIYT